MAEVYLVISREAKWVNAFELADSVLSHDSLPEAKEDILGQEEPEDYMVVKVNNRHKVEVKPLLEQRWEEHLKKNNFTKDDTIYSF